MINEIKGTEELPGSGGAPHFW